MTRASLLGKTASLLLEAGLLQNSEGKRFEHDGRLAEIAADGSLRTFFRVEYKGTSLGIGVLPAEGMAEALAEARSAIAIGRHLLSKGVAVPTILASDWQSGLILFEDCGDFRLHDVVGGLDEGNRETVARVDALYRETIRRLVQMQWEGCRGFDTGWCYDSPSYDRRVMLKRESGYFFEAFWSAFLGGEDRPGLTEEFEDIASQAEGGDHTLFFHRDFQCRNIMVVGERVYFIDYQAGRLGPPGYDLASLLIDPYSSLPENRREKYYHLYLDELGKITDVDEQRFRHQYVFLALQRNLQILGAFAFLHRQRGRIFFRDYIIPALENLCTHLNSPELRCYSLLRKTAAEARQRVARHLK